MSVEIIYKEDNEKLFWDHWDKYASLFEVSPRYLKSSIEYSITVLKSKGIFYADKSFVYLENKKLLACVFLPIENENNRITISNMDEGGYVLVPLISEKRVEKKIFEIIFDLANKIKISKINFNIDPLDLEATTYNYLQKYGFLDSSLLSFVIDLSVEDILKNMRKGHRSDIKRILNDRDFKTFIINQDSADPHFIKEYKHLHHKCAGIVTRSDDSFDIQFKKILSGNAILSGLKYKNKTVAYAYFEYNGSKAIYASGVDDPEFDKLPLYHPTVFAGIEYLKSIGVQKVDTCQPSSPSHQLDYYPDKKQKNIALFKRGFPGCYVPHYRGVKYLSSEEFYKDIEKFVKNYNEFS